MHAGTLACPDRARSPHRRVQGAGSEPVSLIDDGEGAIESLMDFHAYLRITGSLGIRQDLDRTLIQGDGVVIGDGAQVLEAKHGVGVEVLRPRTIGGLRLRCGLREAAL